MFVIFFFSPSENHFTLQRLLLLHETRGIISLLAFKADINAKEISRSILNDHIIKKKNILPNFLQTCVHLLKRLRS